MKVDDILALLSLMWAAFLIARAIQVDIERKREMMDNRMYMALVDMIGQQEARSVLEKRAEMARTQDIVKIPQLNPDDCAWCHCTFHDDGRGGCSICGGPQG